MLEELTPLLRSEFAVSTIGILGTAFLSWLITWLACRAGSERLKSLLESHRQRLQELADETAALRTEAQLHESTAQNFRHRMAELATELESERRSAAEKKALLDRAEERLSHTFKALSAEALKASTEQFLHVAKSSFMVQSEEAKSELERRKEAIASLVKPVGESLSKLDLRLLEIEKERQGAYAALREQVQGLALSQQALQRETAALVQALRQPAGRGQWGEVQLRRVVELAGMLEHCDFTMQDSSADDEGKRLRPDLIVRLPGGKTIVVDAKAPMAAYLAAIEATDDEERQLHLQAHCRQVREQIRLLSSKRYAAQFGDTAPEFVVMFLPSEAFFSAALAIEPGLIEHGVEQGVILATPTTLIALLRAVAFGWRQEALASNAREISALGRQLHERLGTLSSHFSKLGHTIGLCVDHYNRAIGSFESRVLSSARRFEELKASPEGVSLEELEPIDRRPRALASDSLPASAPATSEPLLPSLSQPDTLSTTDYKERSQTLEPDQEFALVPGAPPHRGMRP